MYSLDKIKVNIVKQINQALGKKLVQASDLVYPPKPNMGDLSLSCFVIAKKLRKSSVEIAGWLVGEIRVEGVIIALKSAGPYVNFTINKVGLSKDVLKQIDKIKNEYGQNKSGKNKRVMIEYSNANTHKEYHVGHLRNVCFGDAVNKILLANGYNTVPVSYINDFGIHVAKTLWAYLEFYKDKELAKNKGYFLGQIYARSIKELERDPLAKEKVIFMMKKIEKGNGDEYRLWQKTRKWSIEQLDKIYQELGIKFAHIFYESEFIARGMKIVEELYKKRFLVKSEGAIIANLEKYGLDILMFLRSDSTALYPVADMPLAMEKIKKYRLDKSIYVVDVRQSLYFKQLFKVLELLGQKKEMIHLSHEFVKLPAGMISSRAGNVITYEDLRERVLNKAISETKKRHKNWSEKKIKQVAAAITNGAIKFEMIKVSANQVITFDINQALRFDGFTAAYLQYTYARINSILKKADNSLTAQTGRQTTEIDFSKLNEQKEYELVMRLAKYPEAVLKAGENYDPSEIAKYLFELTQAFNDYYHSVPVLKAKKEIREARLILITAVSQIIVNGLSLLAIEVVEEM